MLQQYVPGQRRPHPAYLTPANMRTYRDFTIVFGRVPRPSKHGDHFATQYILLQINAFKYRFTLFQHPSANNAAYFASVCIIRLE